ncbi:MAG TPA: haloacid dehalogenase-like hydrolase [Bacteroidales bacterium]|nr:haloacid dehalogenase-like hydrolase [Bacteroidales bacterium]
MQKIGLIFDFDETLVEESTSAFISSLGLEVNKFWEIVNKELVGNGWDPIPAYLYKLIEISNKSKDLKITRQRLIDFSKKLTYKKGVLEFFGNIRQYVTENFQDTEPEFFIISSGIGEIIRNSSIAKEMKDIWACEFHYNNSGKIVFPKNIISFTDKTRYVFQISKGMIGEKYKTKPYEVNRLIPEKDYRIPINKIIYIGDGMTDIPCFSLIKSFGGIPIGVYDSSKIHNLGKAWQFIADKRVTNLHSANYEKESDLYNSILMAIQSIAEKNTGV